MGNRKSDVTKRLVRTIIKTILSSHKDKRFTSRELSDFINHEQLGLGRFSVNPRLITTYIREDWSRTGSDILHEVHGEKGLDGRYSFWMPKVEE